MDKQTNQDILGNSVPFSAMQAFSAMQPKSEKKDNFNRTYLIICISE